jgi:hypothetical protein
MRQLISINSRKFMGSDLYTHNQKHAYDPALFFLGTIIALEAICLIFCELITFLAFLTSVILGIIFGIIKHYWRNFKAVSYVSRIAYEYVPVKTTSIKKAA